jgi:TRAP-type C4-dicarboxylate transport system substrate-binding protein
MLFWAHGLQAAGPEYEIKLATLAPENSSLMRIFKEMNSELFKETEGRVGLKIFSGFALGDERDVFRKMRIGLIHAATFTSNFLSHTNPDMRILQVPFLFNNYQEIDYILDEEHEYLNQGFSKRGYEILGWSEVGFIHIMSTVPISNVTDLKGKKVWARANSPMANAVFAKAQVSPVTLGTPDVLVALQTNLLEVVYNSPYYALITQWYSRIKYINDLPLTYIGGALIISKKALSRLPLRLQETLQRVCWKHLQLLTEKTRKDNTEALSLIYKRGVKKITPDQKESEGFKETWNQALRDIDPELLSRDYLMTVKTKLEEYRTRQ